MNSKIKLIFLSAILTLSLASCSILSPVETSPSETHPTPAFSQPATEENTEKPTQTTDVIKPEEIPFEDTSITFAAVGDNLIHQCIWEDASARAEWGEGFNFLPTYAAIADIIARADLSFINQETPLAGDELGLHNYPGFNSPQKLGADLDEMGFDIINVAHNHMLDMGETGLKNTYDYLNSLSFDAVIGTYYNNDADGNLTVVERDGVKIGLLAYTYGTNSGGFTGISGLNIPYMDNTNTNNQKLLSEIKKAHEITDFVIVSLHWGKDGAMEPLEEQKALAKDVANAGADVILGHHSHVLHPLEWIERDDGGKTLCAYSLGNIVGAQLYSQNMVSGVLGFTIASDGAGGLCATDIKFTPTVFYYAFSWYNTQLYLLEDYTDEIAATHGTIVQGNDTTSVEKAYAYVKKNIPAEYLPEFMR